MDELPGVISIAAGNFAQEIPAPRVSVYEDRMHAWVTLPDSVEIHMD